jgi:hypothetical protein
MAPKIAAAKPTAAKPVGTRQPAKSEPEPQPAKALIELAIPEVEEKEKEISDISDLLTCLTADLPADQLCWFRGHDDGDWKLLPTLARNPDHLAAEQDLISRFQQDALLLVDHTGMQEWHWLMVMQHHGCPTRLLDWSESPLVALYFAVTNPQYVKCDGALWILLPHALNAQSGIRPRYPKYIPTFGDQAISTYTPTGLASENTTSLNPIAIIGPRNTARMQAQLGVFTVIHREATAIDAVPHGQAGPHAWRYRIPAGAKPHLTKQLATLGMKKFQLFPELQSIGELLKGGLK